MAQSETLREFLVSLAYKVDESSERRVTSNIDKVTKLILGLGAALEGAAVALSAAVVKVADGMESIYYAAQRSGESASKLRALTFAAGQLGSTAEAAGSSFEEFTVKLRSPGFRSLLDNLVGKSGDAADKFIRLGAAFNKMPAYMRDARAGQFGIDQHTMFALMQAAKFQELYQANLSKQGVLGNDLNSASKGAADLMNSLREIQDTLRNIVESAAQKFFGDFGKNIKSLNEYLLAHGKEISATLEAVANALLSVARAILEMLANPSVKKAIDDFAAWIVHAKIDDQFDHWKSSAETFAKYIGGAWLLMVLGGLNPIYRLLLLIGAAWAFSPTVNPDGSFTPPFDQRGGAEPDSWWGKTKKGIWDKMPGFMQRFRPSDAGTPSKGGSAGSASQTAYHDPDDFYDSIIQAEGTGKHGDPYQTSLGYMKSPKPLTQMTMDEALAWGEQVRQSQGMNSSAKGAFQIVNTTQRAAMRALGLSGDDMFNVDNQRRMASWIARRQGLGAWEGFRGHPDQLARATAALRANRLAQAAPTASSSTGILPLLTGVGTANAAPIKSQSPFGALAPISQGAAGLTASGDKTVTLNQSVTNNFHGATDPAAAASQIGAYTKRLNADALRNMKGAVD